MKKQYIIGIDQSTQGTKAILLNEQGEIVEKAYLSHEQIISPEGWVSHDGEEICRNTITVVRSLVERSGIDKRGVAAILAEICLPWISSLSCTFKASPFRQPLLQRGGSFCRR